MHIVTLILIGLMAGALSGLVGIGGGVIIIPALVYFLGYSQHLAQGTTLALMVPPIGILAAWAYYNKGFVDIQAAAIIAVAFIGGSALGSKLALGISDSMLRKTFAILLCVIAVKMFLQKS